MEPPSALEICSRLKARGLGTLAMTRQLHRAVPGRRYVMRLIALITILVAYTHMNTAAQSTSVMRGTLVIGILTIESSYAQNTELPARGVPDTLQFWIGPDKAWRIRTYATDHDIHPHSLGDLGKVKDRPAEFARDHIKKHYGDVLASTLVLEFPETSDPNAVRRVLAQHNLKGSLEVAKSGFAFWNPDDGHYQSKTTPR
jgi:hypothetical protein